MKQQLLAGLEAKLEAMRSHSVLSLNYCCIGPSDCALVATFLNKYTSITDFELRGNNIGCAGLTALAVAIRQSYTIRTISLDWNNLGRAETGMQSFFNALSENRSV